VSLNLEYRQRLGQRQPPSHARPPRTTRQSHRPRASDRTIVGILDPRLAGRTSRRHGRSLDRIMNRSGPANFAGCQGPIGAGRRREFLLPVSGENFFLTSPFIELQRPLCGLCGPAVASISDRRARRSETAATAAPVTARDVPRPSWPRAGSYTERVSVKSKANGKVQKANGKSKASCAPSGMGVPPARGREVGFAAPSSVPRHSPASLSADGAGRMRELCRRPLAAPSSFYILA
jgi:hypothetical protein